MNKTKQVTFFNLRNSTAKFVKIPDIRKKFSENLINKLASILQAAYFA